MNRLKFLTEEKLREAAVKLVDSIHDFDTHIILLGGTSSQPAFSLIAEAWRRRYPDKLLPTHMPMRLAKPKDVAGKKVAIFEEVVVQGRRLREAEEKIHRLSPQKVKKLALLQSIDNIPIPDIEIGGKHDYAADELGLSWRR